MCAHYCDYYRKINLTTIVVKLNPLCLIYCILYISCALLYKCLFSYGAITQHTTNIAKPMCTHSGCDSWRSGRANRAGSGLLDSYSLYACSGIGRSPMRRGTAGVWCPLLLGLPVTLGALSVITPRVVE